VSEISLEPISSAQDIEKITQTVLVRALFSKEFCISDFEWDDDELFTSFLEMTDDLDTRNAYLSERDFALTEAKEYVIRSVQEELVRIEKLLGQHCPFYIDANSDLFLIFDDWKNLSAVAIAYMYVVFYGSIGRSNPWINIEKTFKESCRRDFAKFFELASCVSMAGWTESKVWYIGRSRSIHKLMRMLDKFCTFVGSGTMREIAELDSYVKNSNDGGVDAIGVAAPNGSLSASPMVFLLGATIQSGNRKNKIIGDQEKKRFRSLFNKQPNIGFEGVFSVPFAEDQVDIEFCRDSDCRYVHRDALFDGMIRIESDAELKRFLRPQYNSIRSWAKRLPGAITLDIGRLSLHIA